MIYAVGNNCAKTVPMMHSLGYNGGSYQCVHQGSHFDLLPGDRVLFLEGAEQRPDYAQMRALAAQFLLDEVERCRAQLISIIDRLAEIPVE